MRLIKTIPILILTITCSGCVEYVGAVGGVVSSYLSYKTSQIEPVEVTTISKECEFFEYQTISHEGRIGLTEEEKRTIALNNKHAIDNCPNISKPDPVTTP